MPAVTIYLSRLIGIVMLIIGIAMLADKQMVMVALDQFSIDRTPLLLLGFFRVACGAGIVLVHNVWTRGFCPLVVTLTGWVILVRGVMVFFVPPDVMASIIGASHVIDFYYVYAAIPLTLGIYLSLRGFSAATPPLDIATAPKKSSAGPKPRPRRP
jgi:hypothetical protein